jgi:hypothetical protein
MNRLKNLLTVLLVAVTLFGLGLAAWFRTPDQYSLSERRVLAQSPSLSGDTLASDRFMSDFEEYTLDQFPLRDGFRAWKAATALNLLLQKDNNGLYQVEGYLSKLDYPLQTAMVDNAAQKISAIYQQYLDGTNCQIYLSVVPDKNYYLAPLGGYPTMDYSALVARLTDQTPFAAYVDLFSTLSLEQYYRTDTHWRQETLLPVAQKLGEAMGATLSLDFTTQQLETPFYGTYCGQYALSVPPDTIYYLTSPTLEGCTVTSYDTGSPVPSALYDFQQAADKDAYDLFLSGSEALLVIENPAATTDRELVIFRDSFGSSLTPLLVSGYAKVTLVDLRYLSSQLVGQFVSFEDQDVLFLYSTLLLNNSTALK